MNDLRFACRMIGSHRWFSLAVVLTLAVGIGINSTVFTLSGAVLFKPLPFRDGERLVLLTGTRNTGGSSMKMDFSLPDFLDVERQTSSFETLAAAANGTAVIGEFGRPPERFNLSRVTARFFETFRTEPALGRVFRTEEFAASGAPVAIIGHKVWRNRYNASPGVIGTTVRLNERATTIVGVMPEAFGMPELADVWIPLQSGVSARGDRSNRGLTVLGLMKPDISIEAARADVMGVAQRLQVAYPDTNKDIAATVLTPHERFIGGKARTVFTLMIAAVALVLVVACANVANMMFSRALSRQREMLIRAALGASRWRLVRQLLVESLVLSGAGGLAGLAIAAIAVPAFDRALAEAGPPSWIVFSIDYSVLAYTAAVCIVSALLFGLAPAIRASAVELQNGLKDGGRGGSGRMGWLSGALVVVQFALAVVLLTASGLLIRSFMAGHQINEWVPGAEILTGRVELPASRYPDKTARQRFFAAAQDRLERLPGVAVAGVTSALPALGGGSRRFELEGQPVATADEQPTTRWTPVSASYFSIIDLPIVSGRGFSDRDGLSGTESAVVTRTFASRYWPGQNAVGKRLRFYTNQTPEPWMTVVGTTGDLVQSAQDAAPDAVVFVPYRQVDTSSMILAVRAPGDAASLSNAFRSAVQELDADLALSDVRTVASLVVRERWPYRVFGTVFGVFALSALMMAAVGLYAVMSQSTGRRTREIGIRMALGATPGRILGAVMRRGAIQLAIGLALGVAGAFAVTGQMRNLLLGVLPNDPTVFGTSTVLLLAVGLVACLLPARRAALTAPVRALAHEEGR